MNGGMAAGHEVGILGHDRSGRENGFRYLVGAGIRYECIVCLHLFGIRDTIRSRFAPKKEV
jgi:hypothetical protein